LYAAGLVDAVQALQQRNRLLQQDLDTLKLKYTGGLAMGYCGSKCLAGQLAGCLAGCLACGASVPASFPQQGLELSLSDCLS
jgi:hypothetical protein